MKGICLCSGGLDSTLALIKLLEQGSEVVPMYIRYNQWAQEGEDEAYAKVGQWCKDKFDSLVLDPEVLAVDLGDGLGVGSVWGRGIALVGLAAMWAYTHGDDYDFIALGNHKGDVGPDCKPGLFEYEMGKTLTTVTKGKMQLLLPIRDLTIEDIGIQLKHYGIPFDMLYSCYWHPSCGYKSKNDNYLCPGCRRKVLAMKAAGITDEKLLNFPNGRERSYQSKLAERTDY